MYMHITTTDWQTFQHIVLYRCTCIYQSDKLTTKITYSCIQGVYASTNDRLTKMSTYIIAVQWCTCIYQSDRLTNYKRQTDKPFNIELYIGVYASTLTLKFWMGSYTTPIEDQLQWDLAQQVAIKNQPRKKRIFCHSIGFVDACTSIYS